MVAAFFVFKCFNQFGNQEIGIRPTLAMRMRELIDRYTVDQCQEIGTVIKIETTQEKLVGFALATMLGRNEARHRFQHFPRA